MHREFLQLVAPLLRDIRTFCDSAAVHTQSLADCKQLHTYMNIEMDFQGSQYI